ncbi:hypothetical protein [Armatimonas sp.]|uniref:hypothetical protein n=1 Tax=Armatimonas sp. TaxID=1872638 RepID=UPI00286B631D|nr:hypothetical protein [Armatimonas sp.]
MNPRILVLIAMLAGLFLLMVALIRWGESYRLHQREQQQLTPRESFRRAPVVSHSPTPYPGPIQPMSPPARFSQPTTFIPVVARRQIASPTLSQTPMMRYLGDVRAIEQDRQRVWQAWSLRLTPTPTETTTSSQTATPEARPTPSPGDLMASAAQWDKKLAGKLPDSTCLPFHLAYLRYLALEQDYLQRLTVLAQTSSQQAQQALRSEMEQALAEAAIAVRAKLRDLQHDHPELNNDLSKLQIR